MTEHVVLEPESLVADVTFELPDFVVNVFDVSVQITLASKFPAALIAFVVSPIFVNSSNMVVSVGSRCAAVSANCAFKSSHLFMHCFKVKI